MEACKSGIPCRSLLLSTIVLNDIYHFAWATSKPRAVVYSVIPQQSCVSGSITEIYQLPYLVCLLLMGLRNI